MASEVLTGDSNHYRVGAGVSNSDTTQVIMDRHDPTTKRKLVDSLSVQQGYSSITSGSASNSSSATAAGVVAISTPCKAVTIFVPIGNVGTQVAVGGSNAVAFAGSEVGHQIIKGSSQTFYITDAINLFWCPDTPNDKISYNIWN